MNNIKKDYEYELLAKYITNTISSEEMYKLLHWRLLSADNETLFRHYHHLRISASFIEYNEPEKIDSALNQINHNIDKSNHPRRFTYYLSAAAVLIILVCTSLFFNFRNQSDAYITIRLADNEQVRKLELTDGSVIWLRGGSMLKIPESFDRMNRYIHLNGEAFFDIAKDSLSVFKVNTDHLIIEVKGTTFNVTTNTDRESSDVTLVSGSVDIRSLSDKNLLTLNPGEKITYAKSDNSLSLEYVDVNTCSVWRFEQLIFDNNTLSEIMEQLRGKFNIKVHLNTPGLKDKKYRCVFNSEEDLIEILNILSFIAPIHYEIKTDEIFITEK